MQLIKIENGFYQTSCGNYRIEKLDKSGWVLQTGAPPIALNSWAERYPSLKSAKEDLERFLEGKGFSARIRPLRSHYYDNAFSSRCGIFLLQKDGKTWSADFLAKPPMSEDAKKAYFEWHQLKDAPTLKELVRRLENAVMSDDPRRSIT